MVDISGGAKEQARASSMGLTGPAKFLVAALASAFAYLTLLTAVGQSTQIWSLPGSGLYPVAGAAALSELEKTSRELVVEGPLGLPLPTDSRYRDLASYALRQEPASVSALRVLGFYAAGTGKIEDARTILLAAEQLKKRDRQTSLWLVQDSFQRDDVSGALLRFDQILRSAGDTRGSMLAVMTQLLSDSRSVPFLTDLLRANPPWANEFWYFIARNRTGLENAADLRRRLIGTPVRISTENDALLLGALVESGQIEEAATLYGALTKRPQKSGPVSFSFHDQPEFPPFDWELPSSDKISARLSPSRSMLEVLAPPDQEGISARRLIKLSPGRYRLSLAATKGSEIGGMRAGILCAGVDRQLTVSDIRTTQDGWYGDVSVPAQCGWAWLQIIAGPHSGQGYNVSLETVRISPVTGESRTPQPSA